jgi:Zn-dependent peptidase ImmA (M78 family)
MLALDQQDIIDIHTASIPVRVGKLAQDLGLEVVLSGLSPNISGLIEPSQTAKAGFVIKVNKYESDERQRFTIAHELAHYLLHRDHIKNGVIDNVMYRSSLSSKKETEANKLAADILMPNSFVLKEISELGGKRDEVAAIALARKFRVSTAAMKVRLGIA